MEPRVSAAAGRAVLTLRAALREEPLPPPPAAAGAGGGRPLAAAQAPGHAVALGEMKRMLAARGARLPPARFDATDAELLRYADDAGLLNVRRTRPRAPRARPRSRAPAQRMLSMSRAPEQCASGTSGAPVSGSSRACCRARADLSLCCLDMFAPLPQVWGTAAGAPRALRCGPHKPLRGVPLPYAQTLYPGRARRRCARRSARWRWRRARAAWPPRCAGCAAGASWRPRSWRASTPWCPPRAAALTGGGDVRRATPLLHGRHARPRDGVGLS